MSIHDKRADVSMDAYQSCNLDGQKFQRADLGKFVGIGDMQEGEGASMGNHVFFIRTKKDFPFPILWSGLSISVFNAWVG